MAELADLVNGYPFDSSDFADSGDVPLVRIRDILGGGFETFVAAEVVPDSAYIRDRDVVIGMDGDFNVSYWSRGPAALNQRLCLLRENGSADTRFLAYAISDHLKVINDLTYSTTVKHLSSDQVRGIRLSIPDHAEQVAIADFLDRETAQINELIAEQQRLIGLLSERRQAVAAQVLGDRVGAGDRLKWFLAESDVRAGPRSSELPLMSVSISWGVRRREAVTDGQARAEDLSNYKVCEKGELVINRMRAFQGALGLAPEDGLVSPDYAVLRVGNAVDAKWLAAVMKTQTFIGELSRRVKGIGSSELGSARTPRINVADLGDIRVDVPSQRQQAAERDAVERQVARIVRLIDEAERFIELARERRSALITAAVTGQIDVRSVA